MGTHARFLLVHKETLCKGDWFCIIIMYRINDNLTFVEIISILFVFGAWHARSQRKRISTTRNELCKVHAALTRFGVPERAPAIKQLIIINQIYMFVRAQERHTKITRSLDSFFFVKEWGTNCLLPYPIKQLYTRERTSMDMSIGSCATNYGVSGNSFASDSFLYRISINCTRYIYAVVTIRATCGFSCIVYGVLSATV